jgi:prenyltransferase beta subunit
MKLPHLKSRAAACGSAPLIAISALAVTFALLTSEAAALESARQDARPDATAENNPLLGEMTPDLHEAVTRGFQYLQAQQNIDGSFGRGRYPRNVGITSLCALAFMSDGHLPGRGPYGEEIQRALDFVLAHQHESGLLAAETSHGPMYGHGFAALFLAEIYGMNPQDRRVHEALVKSVELIVGTQNEEGGWRYNPIPYDADVSVTIAQVMALRAARNAGISVPRETIDRAVEYIRNCQNPDGGFRYMLQPSGSAWPRTAAGVATLFYAGIYEDDSIERGLDYLIQTSLPGAHASPSQVHYYYGHYYAVQAMYLAGGERWQTWWPAIREELVARQSSSGGWLDHHAGGAYGTAMALIVLQMPKRYLPIFQR